MNLSYELYFKVNTATQRKKDYVENKNVMFCSYSFQYFLTLNV